MPGLAFEKPRRENRKRANIDTSELALSKSHFLRDADYRAWVAKTHRCLLHKYEGACFAPTGRTEIEAAHLDHGGKGIKGSDASVIPLCPRHHDALDTETLPWQIVAFLWKHAWALREEWHRRQR